MDNASLARDVAKWVVTSIVNIKTTKLVADTITDRTRFEKDDMVVRLSSGAFGLVVAARVKPVTDRYVDKTADFLVEKRSKFAIRKNSQQD